MTYTGEAGGVGVSACSTGIGCPSAAVMVEELMRIGVETFIRVGTTGSLQPVQARVHEAFNGLMVLQLFIRHLPWGLVPTFI